MLGNFEENQAFGLREEEEVPIVHEDSVDSVEADFDLGNQLLFLHVEKEQTSERSRKDQLVLLQDLKVRDESVVSGGDFLQNHFLHVDVKNAFVLLQGLIQMEGVGQVVDQDVFVSKQKKLLLEPRIETELGDVSGIHLRMQVHQSAFSIVEDLQLELETATQNVEKLTHVVIVQVQNFELGHIFNDGGLLEIVVQHEDSRVGTHFRDEDQFFLVGTTKGAKFEGVVLEEFLFRQSVFHHQGCCLTYTRANKRFCLKRKVWGSWH